MSNEMMLSSIMQIPGLDPSCFKVPHKEVVKRQVIFLSARISMHAEAYTKQYSALLTVAMYQSKRIKRLQADVNNVGVWIIKTGFPSG